jgi:hypothetical protein
VRSRRLSSEGGFTLIETIAYGAGLVVILNISISLLNMGNLLNRQGGRVSDHIHAEAELRDMFVDAVRSASGTVDTFQTFRADASTVILKNRNGRTRTVLRCAEDAWMHVVWVREVREWEVLTSRSGRVAGSVLTFRTTPVEDPNGVTLVISTEAGAKSIPAVSEYLATFRVAEGGA